MQKLNILLTNDDGYQSVGLQELAAALSQQHNVYVVAPDSQRSACSHAIHFHSPLKFVKLAEYFGTKLAYISSGMPADCVKFGVLQFGVKFDVVIAGPNNCENYGHDVLYSATVGGAEEGVVWGDGTKIFTFPYEVGTYKTVPLQEWKYNEGEERTSQPNLYT